MNTRGKPSRHNAPVPAERPSVARYLDARRFLEAAYEYEKARNTSFSHRFVAREMGSTSSGFFKDILSGRVRVSPIRALKFAKLFRLDPAETARFEILVRYTQAETPQERDELLTRLSADAAGRSAVLEASQLEYFATSLHATVRELLAVTPARDTPEDCARIGATLDPPATAGAVAESLRLLLRLRLVKKDAQGNLHRAGPVVRSGPDAPEKVRPALRGNLELALRSLDAHAPAERPFSYLTLSVSEPTLKAIRTRLAELRRDILELATRDPHVDRLYQLNMQLFPVSRIVKPPKEGKP